MEYQFVGVILGGDVNSYGVARAFYDEYKIKTIILGQSPLFPTTYSNITECYYYDKLLDSDVLIKALKDVDKLYPNKRKILLGNTDYYVRHIIANKDNINKISKNFIMPFVTLEQFDTLVDKEKFYDLCEKHGLDYPKTVIFDFQKDDIEEFESPYGYPLFMKPNDSVLYSKYDFENKQKGYTIHSNLELKSILESIKKSGFNGKFLIQEYVDTDDYSMFVFTCYANQKHKVEVVTGGRILMLDKTPELIGNYNAITNFYNKEISMKLKKFLEDIKFTGICHFDVAYDKLRKKYVVFEINVRQGRSNYYTLASGVNLMKYLVTDYVYNKDSKFYIADTVFTASLVSKGNLKEVLYRQGIKHKIKNFSRYTLCPYDHSLKRCYYQFRWDNKIMNAYFKYNRYQDF